MDIELRELNEFLEKYPSLEKSCHKELYSLIESYLSANNVPRDRDSKTQEMGFIQRALRDTVDTGDEKLQLLFLSCLKVLFRIESNRKNPPPFCIETISVILKVPYSSEHAIEAAKVVLNLCYERENIRSVINNGIIDDLIKMLRIDNSDIRCASLGALQSITYNSLGRIKVRELEGVILVCNLIRLSNNNHDITIRSISTLHNISSDPMSLPIIRESGIIPIIIKLLRYPHEMVAGSAAGCLQNLARDEISKNEILTNDKIMNYLGDLVFSNDVLCQTCSIGALMNLAAPENDCGARQRFMDFLSDSLSISIIFHSLFSNDE